jgi:hypothetical protein
MEYKKRIKIFMLISGIANNTSGRVGIKLVKKQNTSFRRDFRHSQGFWQNGMALPSIFMNKNLAGFRSHALRHW